MLRDDKKTAAHSHRYAALRTIRTDQADNEQRGPLGSTRPGSVCRGNDSMKQTRSITVRLSLVFLFLFLVAILLGAFGIGSLSYFNEVSSQIRSRWLPSTGFLGDLNNHTSDFRGVEAASILATNATELAISDQEIQQLDRTVAASQENYQQIAHDPEEDALYQRFVASWAEYRRSASWSRELARSGDRAGAIASYISRSKATYDSASDALDTLTAYNLRSAQRASLRESEAYQRARWLILVTIGMTGLSVAGAMVYVRRSISVPILALADRMHRLAANDTGIALENMERHDEIGEMARAVSVFRGNAIELMNSRIGLEQQATMLREKLAEEQRLMLLQRNFISMASHEFRTPITVIDAHAQRLVSMGDRLTPDALVERVRKIRNAVRRMTHLIENLIDSMRVIDGDVKLYFHPSCIDITALLHEVCLLQREIAPQAQILEDFQLVRPMMVGDASLLLQVFSNLLSNAIKYSPDGGLISVEVELEHPWLVISVQDRGIGIPKVDLARLFERYQRGSNAAGIVGTGLGLYFVKTVVELHGGQIAAENREGGGSCFRVKLPCRASLGDIGQLDEQADFSGIALT
jgi:two-component system OmpR family sensor kinase